MQLNDSPVIALNRAVALAKVQGVKAGLTAIEKIRNRKLLEKYYLFYAVRGELLLQLKQYRGAKENFHRALGLTSVSAEKQFLDKKLRFAQRN